jgi:hypothetical protein
MKERLPALSRDLEWTKRFDPNPLVLLLKTNECAIRYLVYKNILHLQDYDPLVVKVRKELGQNNERNKLLSGMQSSKYFKLQEDELEKSTGLFFLSHLQKLHRLLDLGCNLKMQPIRSSLIQLIKMQNHDGSFPMGTHHTAYAMWVLLNYGLEGNLYVEKGMRWLVHEQREDGGWSTGVGQKSGSCIWTTLVTLNAISLHSRHKKRQRTLRGVKFINDHFLQPNPHGILPDASAWNYLQIGYDGLKVFRGGSLRFLEVLVNLGFTLEDPTVQKIAKWLMNLVLKSGLWPAIVGIDDQGSEWVTYRAINILQKLHFREIRGKETKKVVIIK